MLGFELIEKHGDHEQVLYCHDKDCGLKAIIAVHDTTLGPALGGTRMWNYADEEAALVDVLRLSRGMTYKASAAGLNLGGGKAVIIGDPKKDKSEAMFRTFGAFIHSLGGKYITAEDVGTTVDDMSYIFMETPYVAGIPASFGGSGDPSPFTAHGTLAGIRASVKFHLGADELKDVRVNVQGLGGVGSHLVEYLVKAGARVGVADIDRERVARTSRRFNVEVLDPETIVTAPCDVFAPCALGAVINDKSLPNLKCKIIAGGANNQLAESRHGAALAELGILYAPDYVINAGGLMNVFVELEGYAHDRAYEKTQKIYDTLLKIYGVARAEEITTEQAADRVARERLDAIGRLRRHHHGRTARPNSTLREMIERHN